MFLLPLRVSLHVCQRRGGWCLTLPELLELWLPSQAPWPVTHFTVGSRGIHLRAAEAEKSGLEAFLVFRFQVTSCGYNVGIFLQIEVGAIKSDIADCTLQITALNNKRKTIIDNINFFPLFKDVQCNVWPAGDRGYQGTQQKHHSVVAGSHCGGPQWQMTVRSSQWCQISVAVLRHSGKGVNVSMTVSERERWRLCELYLKVFAKPKRIPVLAHFAESDWRALLTQRQESVSSSEDQGGTC